MSGERLFAWSVHLYTALGAPIALLALVATVSGRPRSAFLWMALAIFVDATDGALARKARVKEVLPEFDGTRLDDVVDYLNYVVVPIFFAWRFELFPPEVAPIVLAAPLLASAYGFCRSDAKTGDFFFTGFPSYWNIVVFYLYVLETSPTFNAALVAAFSILVFVRIGYVYPSRTPFARPLTIGLGALWALAVVAGVFRMPEAPKGLLWASLAYPAYYFALSLFLDRRRRRAA